MSGFALLMVAAAIAFGLSKLLRLPQIPMLMLSGIGLHMLLDYLDIQLSELLLGEMIEIGLAMLVFTTGADLSPQRMRGNKNGILIVATTQFVALGITGICTAIFLNYDLTTALYLGFALSASSTLVVVRQLQQRRQMFEPFGRLVLGVLLVQDVFIILLMVTLLSYPEGFLATAGSLVGTIALGLIALMLHRKLIPWVTQHLKLDEEELMLGAFGMLFTFSGIAYLLGLPFLVGSFLAGFALSAFPMNGLVRGMLGSLSSFFLALFFISIGAILTMPNLPLIQHSLIFIAVLIGVTVLLVTLVGEMAGYATRTSIETGLLLSQTSEFSLLLAYTGTASGMITQDLFSMIALITVSTMTLTPVIAQEKVRWLLMRIHPRYRRGEKSCTHYKDHAVLLGYGRAGAQNLKFLREHGLDVIVIDEDASVIRQLINQNVPCIQGSISNKRLLKQTNCKQARVVICSMRQSHDAHIALDYLRNYPVKVIVSTFEHSETDYVRQAGGYPVETALASSRKFIEWVDTNLAASNNGSCKIVES